VTEDQRGTRLERLKPFVAEWRIEAPAFPLPPELADTARTAFEWTLGGAFLFQRSSIPVPGAPESMSVIGPVPTTVTPSTTSTPVESRAFMR
jgi:hypothetical protein